MGGRALEKIVLNIDGERISTPPGTTVLEAAENSGIKIPTLCHHPDLKPFGACRLCLVEDENTGRLMASCVTPAARNMAVRTNSVRIKKHRTNIVRLMIAEHPESCVVCSKGNRCRLRQVAADLGIGETNLYPMPNAKPPELVNPFIVRDLSKCVLCGKCIRADHELVVVGAIDYNLRGFRSRPMTVHDLPLEKSSCTFCGTCVSMCPTGALAAKNTTYAGTPEKESLSICGFCGVGCSLFIGVAGGVAGNRIVETNPSHMQDTVNHATLCIRGHFAHDFLNAGNRLLRPFLRKTGDSGESEAIDLSWEEALEKVAFRLLEIKRQDGPRSIAFLGSSKCTNEENYLFQKIARVYFETNNIDNGSYVSGRCVLKHLDDRTDGGGRISRLAALEEAEAIFVIGSNPVHSVPVAGYFIKRAARKGIPLIVADPRRTELVDFSMCWLPIKPKSDSELINGIAAILNETETYDHSYIYRYTEDFSRYRSELSRLDLDGICKATGIGMKLLREAAGVIGGKKIAFVIGSGILQQQYALRSMEALLNLSLFTGSLGCEGAGFYFIAGENNQVGAWDMGAVPDELPGRQLLDDASIRKKWERAWKVSISPDPGLNLVQMVEEAEKGNLKALYIMGENPLRSFPDPDRVKRALEKIDFVVVQDILDGETAKIADVILPGAAFSEKKGSFTNLEGRIQSFDPVAPPPGEAKPDLEILALLEAKLGESKPNRTLETVRSEIRRMAPGYKNLADQGSAWIRESSEKQIFHAEEKGSLIPFFPVASPAGERPDDDLPFTAVLGTLRYHLGSGSRTNCSKRIQQFEVEGGIEISPEDGKKLDAKDGDILRVVSQSGAIERRIHVTRAQPEGHIFIPMAFNGNDAMRLLNLTQLGKRDSPGWKTCRVRVEKIQEPMI